MKSMLSSRLLVEPRGTLLTIFSSNCCSVGYGGQFSIAGAADGAGYTSWAVAIRGFSIPGACGPNLARIASNSWDFLSRLLLDETRVESAFSSYGT